MKRRNLYLYCVNLFHKNYVSVVSYQSTDRTSQRKTCVSCQLSVHWYNICQLSVISYQLLCVKFYRWNFFDRTAKFDHFCLIFERLCSLTDISEQKNKTNNIKLPFSCLILNFQAYLMKQKKFKTKRKNTAVCFFIDEMHIISCEFFLKSRIMA